MFRENRFIRYIENKIQDKRYDFRETKLKYSEKIFPPIIDYLSYKQSVRRLRWRMYHEGQIYTEFSDELDDIIHTALNTDMSYAEEESEDIDFREQYIGFGPYRSFVPLQIRYEITELAKRVQDNNPESVIEIGTDDGGTLYIWCRCLDSASTIISLDLPGGDFGGGYPEKKARLFEQFAPAKDLHFVRGNSHEQSTFQSVEEKVPEGGVDFLFIDGDHAYEGVKQDFEVYKPLVRDGGMIAFHDIVPGSVYGVGGVPDFWEEIKEDYETEEIVEDWDQGGYGIGVVYL